jgi:aromatic ring-cleaving dioxygenase
MITQLKIERFKSVRQLELNCRRVNLFIGEPNTGKSNILEALGMLSWLGWPGGNLKSFVRFHLTQNLFYDHLTDEPIRIECKGTPNAELTVKLEAEQFGFYVTLNPGQLTKVAHLDFRGNGNFYHRLTETLPIKFYRYHTLEKYESAEPGALIPPHGTNLFSVVFGSKALREWVVELFRPYGLAVVLKPHERAIELQKQQDGVVIGYPFGMSSDTLQRMLFYNVAMESNKDAVLVFEEPEAHAFPYYTKHLGERIAADASNQYFIATHNPYLLVAVLEKAKKEEVHVFATQYRDYETKVTPLTEDQICRLLDADPFLGLKGVLEAE